MNPLTCLAIISAQLNPDVGDVRGNLALARKAREEGVRQDADLVILPELFLCGYPPEDLVLRSGLVAACHEALQALAADTARKNTPGLVIGLPFVEDGHLYNAVALIADGAVQALRFKHELPDYGVFDEKRLFREGPLPEPVFFRGWGLGLTICEDLWHRPVAQHLAGKGAQLLISVNGSPWRRGKRQNRLQALRSVVSGLPLVWVNRVGGQDELVFDGASFALDGLGRTVQQLPDFESCLSLAVWERAEAGTSCRQAEQQALSTGEEEIYRAIVLGLHDYVSRAGFETVLLGLSGGIDSAMTLALCVDALGAERVRSVMLPWRYTSAESLADAMACAQALGVEHREMDIGPVLEGMDTLLQAQQLEKQAEAGAWALAQENMQARVRGLVLMALSNALGLMLITTGNRSELAMGYATLYGDMCGGYNPLKGLYKTEVYKLARWRNRHCPKGGRGPQGEVIPERILTRPPSAELRPDQTDQDTLPPYELLDKILRQLLEEDVSQESLVAQGYDRAMLTAIVNRLYRSEYKRYQAAPGPRVGKKDFGRDRRYPLNHKWP